MDLPDDHWRGWRVAGRYLVTPGRDRIPAEILEHLVHMHRIRIHFETVGLQAQATAAKQKRSARRGLQLVKVIVVDMAHYRRERGYRA